jgi:periplasmic copper chaperone A
LKIRTVLCSALAVLVMAPVADAHVTLNPSEWEAGGFARFALRVPTERDDASTTEITVRFPENVTSASFMPAPGWRRTVEMAALDEPIEEEGEEPITERIASVTWSGGEIRPGEFMEFGVSFQVPEDADELLFPSLQTYSNGEVVRWIDPDPAAESPAPRVTVLPPAEEGEDGEEAAPPEPTTEEEEAAEPAASAPGGDDDDGRANLALVFGIAGLLAGLVALAVALFRRPRAA